MFCCCQASSGSAAAISPVPSPVAAPSLPVPAPAPGGPASLPALPAPLALPRAHVPVTFDLFLSFEWLQGLPVAQLLHAALRARAPHVQCWFALEQDAASPAAMAGGVAASSAFVFLATRGALLKPNVRHEVACAVLERRRIIVLQEAAAAGCASLEGELEAAAGYVQADAAGDKAKGRLHLDAAALAAFAEAARRGPRLLAHRSALLVSETLPALLGALALPAPSAAALCPPQRAPFTMRALRREAGCCDALIVAASSGALQALYLAETLQGACQRRALVVSVLPSGTGAPTALAAASKAAAVVLVLSAGAGSDAGFLAAAGAAVRAGLRLALVHEVDADFGGAPFFSVLEGAPESLAGQLSASGVATVFRRKRAEAEVMLGEVMLKVGAQPWREAALPPPPLPAAFDGEPVADVRARVAAALGARPAPAAVVVGGLGGAGKTTLASSLALDEGVVGEFDDVAWVTVGKVADNSGMLAVLQELLDALEPAGAAASAALDPLAAAVQRLRAVCERRAVLLVADDVWAPSSPWAPDAAGQLLACVSGKPQGAGGAASRVLVTCRDVQVFEALEAKAGAAAGRSVAMVSMGELEHGVAVQFLTRAARLQGAVELQGLFAAVGKVPIALSLAAACLRALMEGITEAEAVETLVERLKDEGVRQGAPISGAWLASEDFCQALARISPNAGEAAYAPIFRALQAALNAFFGDLDKKRFAVFGLFAKDVYVPEGVLAAAWGVGAAATQALLLSLQSAVLVKWEPQAARAVLHDLARDFSAAIAGTGRGGLVGAHGALIDKCALLSAEASAAGCWWRGQLLAQMRLAGRGAEGSELLWSLQWLVRGVRERGGATVAREVAAQLAWEKAQGAERAEEAKDLRLLHQMLVMAAQALEGEAGAGNVAAQVIGRLGGREEGAGAGGARCAGLVAEARRWDGGGAAWLRPLRANFEAPGGACEGVMFGHVGSVTCVCALGDGRFVSGAVDETLRVWESATGVCVRVLEGHSGAIKCVCALGGGLIASASALDKALRVWDAVTGLCVAVLEGHKERVNCVSALGAGSLVSGSWDTTVRVWDAVGAGEGGAKVLEGHTLSVNCVAAEGGCIVSGSRDDTLRLWDSASGACLRVLQGHKASVSGVCALGGGRFVSCASNALRVWRAATGACETALEGLEGFINAVCALDGGRCVSAADDGSLTVWDASTGARLGVLEGHTDTVNAVCALGGGRAVSAAGDHVLRVWDAGARASKRAIEGHAGLLSRVCVLEGGRVASQSLDKTLKVWDAATGACLETLQGGSARALEVARLPDCGSDATQHCGRTRAHFSPWGAPPVHLGAEVHRCALVSHPASGRRTAVAFTASGAAHAVELIEPQAKGQQ
jgi:WD40 repeat protein